MLRRTKGTLDSSGKSIVQLPTKHLFVERLDLGEPEREFYQALFDRSKAAVRGYDQAAGAAHVYARM